MENFTATLLSELTSALQEIAVTSENKLQQAERSFNAAEMAISKLREFIADYTFKSVEEEIRFFKEIKPEFQKELIYNEEVLFIESNCPISPEEPRKVFIDRALNRIQAYFEKHNYIYNYCRSGQTTFDTLFFVRLPKPIPLTPVSFSDIDPEFSNPHSYKVAKLKALEELREYIRNEKVQKIEPRQEPDKTIAGSKRNRIFTGPKAAIEEILQGMLAKGWINYGDYAAQQLFHDFESFFNVKLSDPSRSLIGMAIRKNGYTPHIDKMKDALIDRIERKHQ
ncbi:RteC domain-containing protein [Sphingobacterium detergens]|uniref:RteC protein n=1 Tax=Sphingobacterium detergens TaxID=1145106 RepID=A0A420ARS6_SPHD1|nr:RteC domain-containing protein [Sphingobacterium detergens]RKE47168.1 RteC protein [Sphingobacterium detergens]